MRGALRSVRNDYEEWDSAGWAAFAGQPQPVFAGTSAERGPASTTFSRVWRDGTRTRIESADGSPELIVGDESCWQFEADGEPPVVSTASAVRYLGSGTQLLVRRGAEDFIGDDFTRPTGSVGSTTFLGRAAWTVELAPPPHKPAPIQLVVDAETGLVLQQRNDSSGAVDEWVEFVVGEALPTELFVWDGPARTPAESREQYQADAEARFAEDKARRSAWFVANVAALPLHLDLLVGVFVHEWDDETGSFLAALGEGQLGLLGRRSLKSTGPFELGGLEPDYRWSDERWEWGVAFHSDHFSESGLETLRRQLSGPGA